MPDHVRTWGFRLSLVDAVVLALAPLTTWWLWPELGAMAGAIPFAVGHFFLFCNVFRIHRRKELLWAALAVANVTGWALADALDWRWVLAVQTPVTATLIAHELRLPRYHGVLARRLNPHLDDWLEGRA